MHTDGMSLLHHATHPGKVFLPGITHHKESGLDIFLLQSLEDNIRVIGGAFVKGQVGRFLLNHRCVQILRRIKVRIQRLIFWAVGIQTKTVSLPIFEAFQLVCQFPILLPQLLDLPLIFPLYLMHPHAQHHGYHRGHGNDQNGHGKKQVSVKAPFWRLSIPYVFISIIFNPVTLYVPFSIKKQERNSSLLYTYFFLPRMKNTTAVAATAADMPADTTSRT